MSSRMKLVAAVFVFLLLFVGFKTETISVLLSGDTEALKALSQGNLLLILLLTLLLMTIQNMFTIIPLILLISVNVALFGFAGGYLWSWLVSIAGAVVSFFITRYWFQGFFAKYVHNQWENKIEENGFWFVFFGRVMPFMPTSVVNIAAGISSVRFNKFFYATVLGNFIYFFFLSAISLGILSIPWDNGIYIGLAVVGLATILLIKRKKRKAPIIESSD